MAADLYNATQSKGVFRHMQSNPKVKPPSTSQSPSVSKTYPAFLFDMDGTLVNSIALVERVWRGWAARRGVEPEELLSRIHGIRAIDVITAMSLAGIDPAKDAAELLEEEMSTTIGIVEIPGAIRFLTSLPIDRWAVVTSAPRELALLRMRSVGIPLPKVMICAEDVTSGKPDPACYQMGASQLGYEVADCLVFEDAPAGILAGERAGSDIVVITATHSKPHPTKHLTIADYDAVVAVNTPQGLIELKIVEAGLSRQGLRMPDNM